MKKIINIFIIWLVLISTASCTNNDNKNTKKIETQTWNTNIQNNIIDNSWKAPVIIEDPSQAAWSVEINDSDDNWNSSDEPTSVE